MNERFSLDGGYIGAQALLSARSERTILSNSLFMCRNPGVDFGEQRWDLDEFSYPLCSGKRKQVQH